MEISTLASFWCYCDCISALSISFEVDVPTETVGDNVLFECRRRELPRGSGGIFPQNVWNLDAWKCYFQRFPDSIWALRTIKIETTLTIFYVYYNRSFPQNLNQAWDLVLWKCPRRSTTLRSRLLYFHRKVNTFKTPELRFYFGSDVWGGCLTIIFVGSFSYFKFLTKINSKARRK